MLNLLNVSGQSIDSLKLAALQLKHDTDRVMLFYQEGFANRAANPQYAYNCASEAQAYAQQASMPYYTAKACNLLGVLYYRKGDLSTALSYHKKALNLRTLIADKNGILMSQTNLGNVFSDLKLYKQAEAAYLAAFVLSSTLSLPKQTGNCLLNLGTLSIALKNLNAADNYFKAALSNAKLRFDYELQAECLNNLAVLNIMKQDFDAAIANALNSVKVKELMDNEMEMADSYLNLSNAYFQKHELPQGLAYLKLADSIIAKYNYTAARLQALLKHADYDAAAQDFKAAFTNLKQYNTLKDSMDEANALAGVDNNFTEFKTAPGTAEKEKSDFPYLYLGILFAMGLGVILFIFRFKR